jgi:hypothetical protein
MGVVQESTCTNAHHHITRVRISDARCGMH